MGTYNWLMDDLENKYPGITTILDDLRETLPNIDEDQLVSKARQEWHIQNDIAF